MTPIELTVNAWYREWLKTNDPYQEDFEQELIALLPELSFTLAGNEWILINN